MSECITSSDKKEFIQWFLNQHQLQKREAAWLLSYLASEDRHLDRVHFVDNLRGLPKTLSIAAHPIQMVPFQFTKNKHVSSDVETAFYDIRSCPHDEIYISLFFKDRATCSEYAAVLEVNPMEKQDLVQDSLLGLMAEIVLDQAVRKFYEENLYQRIDQALAQGDEVKFLQLTEQWRKLMESEG